ncbi:MAG TPA: lipopolysaccharide biosynthesis protein [Anaeromyxobacter sp.]|nr:lipopolysaccharide biosynthesis protein [Anaeromyxobacter sp.]
MERTYTFDDLMAALRRRRALALVVFAGVLAAGLALAALLPAEYTATSTIQLEPRRVTAEFLPAQGIIPLEDRMRTLKHGILARPVLEQVVRDVDFDPGARSVDDAIEKLRRSTEVRLEGEVPGGPPALLFVVAVRGKDPEKVRAAADRLPKVYEERTRRLLAAQAESLRKTLDAEVAGMSKRLAEGERAILEFKKAHAGELPEESESNARATGRAQALLEMRIGALLEAQRRRAALLGAVPEGMTGAGMAEGAVDAAQRRVQAAEAAYGTDHPDVKRARRELEEAIARRDQELDLFRQQRIDEGLKRVDAEIRDHERALAGLRKEIERYALRADAAPRVGAELMALTRDYETLRSKYVSTVSRQADAAAAERLLEADGPSLFRVVEAAAVPARPSAPDRGRLALLAAIAAVAAALGAAALREWLDGSLRGPEDASGHGVPVLAAIPRIGRGSAS